MHPAIILWTWILVSLAFFVSDNEVLNWIGIISLLGGFIAMGWSSRGGGDLGSHDIDPD